MFEVGTITFTVSDLEKLEEAHYFLTGLSDLCKEHIGSDRSIGCATLESLIQPAKNRLTDFYSEIELRFKKGDAA
jgi:hypothetical protein